MLDPRRLEVLVSVAQTGSLTAAARELGVTQPAVGQQLRALEAQCDLSLVERSGRGVRLTPEGMALARRAMPVLAALRDIEDEVHALQRGSASTVSVQATAGALGWLVAPGIVMARSVLPELRVEVDELDARDPKSLMGLLHGDCDVAVVPDGTEGLKWTDVERTPLAGALSVAVVSEENPVSASEVLAWDDVEGQAIVTTSDLAVSLTALLPSGTSITALSDQSAVYDFVRAGLAVGIVPGEVVPVPGDLVSIPTAEPVYLGYHVAMRRPLQPSDAVQAVLDAFTAIAEAKGVALSEPTSVEYPGL